jgi:hypothetical protein
MRGPSRFVARGGTARQEDTVFEASDAFGFFDYFRVPYTVRQPRPQAGHGRLSDPVGRLSAAGHPAAPSLYWLRQGQVTSARPGLYRLHGCTLCCRVAHDQAMPGLLAGRGRRWRQTAPITNTAGQQVAAVWRDENGNVFLPFDPAEVMLGFWSEAYRETGRSALLGHCRTAALKGYYLARPAMPRALQLLLRRCFSRQPKPSFPAWPVEESLHDFYGWLFGLIADLADGPVPHLGLWPDGKSWALVLTHDVEHEGGQRQHELLRSPERDRGLRSAWNFVGQRYRVDPALVRALQAEGCEIGVHGLRHDGRDLSSRRQLRRRLPAMRELASQWQAVGFRSPATQRRWKLMPELSFSYDSSYADTNPYEPQPGGCCTWLPFFIGGLVELPMTLEQDHTLFVILQHPDARVWLRKARMLRERGGMVLLVTHPDYAQDSRLTDGYLELLDAFCADRSAWHALPREVAAWWRDRAASQIRLADGRWTVTGPAAGRGTVQFAGGPAHVAAGVQTPSAIPVTR